MTKEQIIAARKIHKNEDLWIFADNAKLYAALSEGTELIWDDTNQLVHVIKPSINYYNQNDKPAVIETYNYDVIQYIGTDLTLERLAQSLAELKTQGLITDAKAKEILAYHAPEDKTHLKLNDYYDTALKNLVQPAK